MFGGNAFGGTVAAQIVRYYDIQVAFAVAAVCAGLLGLLYLITPNGINPIPTNEPEPAT